jgi:acyl carrier protein
VLPAQSIQLGRPLANTECYVVDARRQPVPPGVAGELLIGGAGVARGYLNRPELTAEKFIPHPFRNDGARLYRTGDLVRQRPDGALEFLGRLDNQVKIRGFRIELGEIETVLRETAAVRDAVVVAREDVAGDKRLVAYLQPRNGAPPVLSELRQQLRAKLPDYMVPAAFVLLDEFPLTPSGKINRRALPAPEGALHAAASNYEAPRTALEEKLAAIWGGVLRMNKVGIRDDFFAVGGHSLLATQMMARVRDALGVQVPLRSLFEHPTVSELAAHVEALLWAKQPAAIPRRETAQLVEGEL